MNNVKYSQIYAIYENAESGRHAYLNILDISVYYKPFPASYRFPSFGKILHRTVTHFRIFAFQWQIEQSTQPVRSPVPFSVRVYAFDRSVVRSSAPLRLHRLCRPKHRCRMPSLIAFGRRWKVGSDDLLLPGAFLFWIHLFEWVASFLQRTCSFKFERVMSGKVERQKRKLRLKVANQSWRWERPWEASCNKKQWKWDLIWK
jgi:hypothetical protein